MLNYFKLLLVSKSGTAGPLQTAPKDQPHPGVTPSAGIAASAQPAPTHRSKRVVLRRYDLKWTQPRILESSRSLPGAGDGRGRTKGRCADGETILPSNNGMTQVFDWRPINVKERIWSTCLHHRKGGRNREPPLRRILIWRAMATGPIGSTGWLERPTGARQLERRPFPGVRPMAGLRPNSSR